MKCLLKKFCDDRRGQFSIMFVLLSFPLLASVGFAIDYTQLSNQRGNVQNANDAAALWAAAFLRDNDYLPTPRATQDYITNNFDLGSGIGISMPQLTRNGQEVTVETDIQIQAKFMYMFGQGTQNVDVLSSASLDFDAILEFSMALDTTFSMSTQGRMPALKTAATNFVDKLWDVAAKGADIKGSIVPFSNYVNIGTEYRNESWMNVPPDIDTRREERQCSTPIIDQINCSGGGVETCYPARTINHPGSPGYTSYNDGVPVNHSGTAPWTENVPAGCTTSSPSCTPVYGPEQCSMVTVGSLTTWHGIVASRDYPYNLRDGSITRRFPGPLGVTAGAKLLPLTGNKTQLMSAINSLVPKGETYIPDGIMWALRTLSPAAPFTEGRPVYTGAAGQKRIRKAILLMTDGTNTISPNFSADLHDYSDANLTDRYTKEACNYAKDEGYEVYTVTFGTSVNSTIRRLMENCASTPDDYYHASSARDLDEAFDEIANSLLKMRLTN